jgi:hypothetical protein
MYPTVPTEVMAGAMELVCFVSTAIAAIVSYILMMRF